ncbi:hypothetical protein AB5J72_45850 [Streptomyces sp. CG1]|uniref:hypothetical protein n=1 Tax=Streptomyces sp. CG1 TaxID=1287523 RepID=UPI0034E20088
MQLLDAFSSMDLYAAMTCEFVTLDASHRPGGPRYDPDMASHAITPEPATGTAPADPATAFPATTAGPR